MSVRSYKRGLWNRTTSLWHFQVQPSKRRSQIGPLNSPLWAPSRRGENMASGRNFVCLGRGPCLKVQLACVSSGSPVALRTPACPLWSCLGWDVPGYVDILTGLRPISVNIEFCAKHCTWIALPREGSRLR